MPGLKSYLNGRKAEARAEAFLIQQGLKIRARNVRFKGGEIDLIARDGDSLVFLEVKYRSGNDFGSATESLTMQQQQRLYKAAQLWLQKNDPQAQLACRFDLIAFGDGKITQEHWLRNAF